MHDYIPDCPNYENAIDTLRRVYVKTKNEMFARHVLATCHQELSEFLDQYMQVLKFFTKNFDFKAISATEACDKYVRNTFINSLLSSIRVCLLENKRLGLLSVSEQAHLLEMAQKHFVFYVTCSYTIY